MQPCCCLRCLFLMQNTATNFTFLSPLFVIWLAIGRYIKRNMSAHSCCFYSVNKKGSSTVGSGQKAPKGRQPAASLAARRSSIWRQIYRASSRCRRGGAEKKRGTDSCCSGGGVRVPFRRKPLLHTRQTAHIFFLGTRRAATWRCSLFFFFSSKSGARLDRPQQRAWTLVQRAAEGRGAGSYAAKPIIFFAVLSLSLWQGQRQGSPARCLVSGRRRFPTRAVHATRTARRRSPCCNSTFFGNYTSQPTIGCLCKLNMSA